MTDADLPEGDACCGTSGMTCVFSKALLARSAVCECAQRCSVGERELVQCVSPTARTNCTTLAALLHERARFALRLPRPGQPLIHAKALRLQCGGVVALQASLGAERADVHRLVGVAHERYGSLTELPWAAIVDGLLNWQPRRRRRAELG